MLICMWWCRCGVDDGFGMNHGGVGLQGVRDGACGCGVGCDWSCAVCSGWAAACMYGVVVVVVLGGIIYDSVDGSG